MAPATGNRRRTYSHGVAALEFALVFPVLFMLLYAMLTYALVFATQHALSLAAAEGGRAAIRFTSLKDTVDDRKQAACVMARQSLGWLERATRQPVLCPAFGSGALRVDAQDQTCPPGANPAAATGLRCMSVVVRYDYGAAPLIPKLPLVPVPERLSGEAVTQIALSY